MVLKPGLIVLVAAEEPSSYVAVAQQALESTGFTIKSGSGYRAYSEERKRADPAWPGIPLGADQDYVVVVGPQRVCRPETSSRVEREASVRRRGAPASAMPRPAKPARQN